MITLVRESDPDTITRREPLEAGRQDRPQSHQPALLAAAHAELAKTLSPDPVEFLELHRQRDGE
jgi:hypothetical protein